MNKSVLAVAAVIAALVAGPVSRADEGVEYYFSLGDSVAQGRLPGIARAFAEAPGADG